VLIEILVDGRPVLTTAQAAALRGITVAGMRAVIRQAGIRPVAHLDERTPLYDPRDLVGLRRRAA
jgi:hypothetical protein